MRKLLLTLPFLPSMASAQQAGWGSVGQQEEKGFSWTDPLWPDFWMAWTPATFTLFVCIFSAIAIIGILEAIWFKDGIERYGAREFSPNIIKRLEEATGLDITAPGFPAEMTDDEPEAPGAEVVPKI